MRGWAICVAVGFLACASASKSTTPQRSNLTAVDYYPMVTGAAWSYDVDTGTGLSTLAVTRVVSREGNSAQVQTSNSPPVPYQFRSEGIFSSRDNVWLLHDPIAVGSSWAARGGRTATITELSETVQTAAGAFGPCVKVSEQGGEAQLEIDTTYCAGVGPVLVISAMRSELTDKRVSVVAKLRGFASSSD